MRNLLAVALLPLGLFAAAAPMAPSHAAVEARERGIRLQDFGKAAFTLREDALRQATGIPLAESIKGAWHVDSAVIRQGQSIYKAVFSESPFNQAFFQTYSGIDGSRSGPLQAPPRFKGTFSLRFAEDGTLTQTMGSVLVPAPLDELLSRVQGVRWEFEPAKGPVPAKVSLLDGKGGRRQFIAADKSGVLVLLEQNGDVVTALFLSKEKAH